MYRVFCLLCAGALGCHNYPRAETGWEFRVGKPPLVVTGPQGTAITTASSTGMVGIDHGTALTNLPAGVEHSAMCGAHSAARYRSLAIEAGRVGAGATAPGCDLDEVCRRLERLERSLHGPGSTSTPAPMPQSPLPPLRQ